MSKLSNLSSIILRILLLEYAYLRLKYSSIQSTSITLFALVGYIDLGRGLNFTTYNKY